MTRCAILSCLLLACVPDGALEDRPCPCIEGWVCQLPESICVRADDAVDAGADLGEPRDAAVDRGMPDAFEPPEDLGQDMPLDMGPGDGPVFAITCESSTATRIPDVTGNGFDGVCVGGCPPLNAEGAIGGACDFSDSVHLEIDIPTGSRLDLPASGASFSLAFWFRVDAFVFASSFSRPYGDATRNSWEFYFSNPPTGVRPTFWRVTEDDRDDLPAPLITTTGEWHHMAVVVDASADETTLYFDGAPAGTVSGSTFLYDDHPILIGGDENDGVRDNFFRGLLDELYFYDRALSEAEVGALATR